MVLILESGPVISNPSPEDIERCLPAEEFVILAETRDSSTYIQFAESKTAPYGYVLEHQIEITDQHFQASDPDIALEQIITAFKKYLSNDPTWKTDFEWRRIDIGTEK